MLPERPVPGRSDRRAEQHYFRQHAPSSAPGCPASSPAIRRRTRRSRPPRHRRHPCAADHPVWHRVRQCRGTRRRGAQGSGKLGFAASVLDMADATPAQIAGAQNLLVIASTWGEGDPPQRAVDFYEALMADDAPRFEGVALRCWHLATALMLSSARSAGVRRTARRSGRDADRRPDRVRPGFRNSGRRRGSMRRWTSCSQEPGEPEAGAVIHVDFARAEAEARLDPAQPFEAEITERVRLTGSRSTSDTWHVELSLEGSGIAYEPGDSLGVVPLNDPALVDAVLAAPATAATRACASALIEQFDITTLTAKQIRRLCRRRFPGASGWLAGDRSVGGGASAVVRGGTSVAAASAGAALFLDRVQPQGGGG